MSKIPKPATALPWGSGIPTDPKIQQSAILFGQMDQPIAFGIRENAKSDLNYARIASNALPALVEALAHLSKLGGNLPDSHYEDGFCNESKSRGAIILEAREVARAALQSIGESDG